MCFEFIQMHFAYFLLTQAVAAFCPDVKKPEVIKQGPYSVEIDGEHILRAHPPISE